MNLGRDLGFQEVLIEGEALSVIKKMQAYDKDGSLIGAYIYDGKHKVVGFIKFDFFPYSERCKWSSRYSSKGRLKVGIKYLSGGSDAFLCERYD